MGKKKSVQPKKPVGVRLSPDVFKKLERYVNDHPGMTLSSAGSQLIEAALSSANQDGDQLTRLLTHFEEQTSEQIATLNYNLRQATGMILMPKPEPKKEPQEKYRIDSPKEAAKWIECKFREIPD